MTKVTKTLIKRQYPELDVEQIGSKQLFLLQHGKTFVAISYQTPIACFDAATGEGWVTEERYSSTTSQHLSLIKRDYLPGLCIEASEQALYGFQNGLTSFALGTKR